MTTLKELQEKRAALEQDLKREEADDKKYKERGKGKGPYAASQRRMAADHSAKATKIKVDIAAINKEIDEKTETP
jgi:hypothetical protein